MPADFSAEAKKAGMSTQAYARKVRKTPAEHDAGTVRKAVVTQALRKRAVGRTAKGY